MLVMQNGVHLPAPIRTELLSCFREFKTRPSFVPSATLPTVPFGRQRPSCGWLVTSFFCGQRLKQPFALCVLPIVPAVQRRSAVGLGVPPTRFLFPGTALENLPGIAQGGKA